MDGWERAGVVKRHRHGESHIFYPMDGPRFWTSVPGLWRLCRLTNREVRLTTLLTLATRATRGADCWCCVTSWGPGLDNAASAGAKAR